MNPYIALAKTAVENYIKKEKIISPPENLPEEFYRRRAGTFVTIEKKDGLRGLPRSEPKVLLRGCIGTYLPTRVNIAEEIIHNAVAAATEDYRFGPIQEEELLQLSYTVYILNYPELVEDIKKLNPKKFGIIVKTAPFTYPNENVAIDEASPHLPPHLSLERDSAFNGKVPYKSGLLLPDLEGVDTAEQQLSIACQKGGIDFEKEKVFIYRFTVEKYQ